MPHAHSLSGLVRVGIAGLCLALLLLAAGVSPAATPAHAQPQVFAEAINQANVRNGPGIQYALVGEIRAGARYPVVGRSAFYPWVLIAVSDVQRGWVFTDLVRILGNLEAVPYTEAIIEVTQTPPPALGPPTASATPPALATPMLNPALASTASAAAATPEVHTGVVIEVQGELNVRFGPGVNYPRLGIVQAGERFAVLRRHTQVEWVEIAYPPAANGRGWVYLPAVKVIGSLNAVPTTSLLDFGDPVLTPTPPKVVTSAAPWAATPVSSTPNGLIGLSNTLYDLLLRQRFDPSTSRQGSMFLMHLNTGQSVSINPEVAYSGMSLIKIGVMVAFFRALDALPTTEEARSAADMMVCSENLSSNAVLRLMGDGSEYRGAEFVTGTLQALGLKNTFLVGPFFVGRAVGQPTPTVEPVSTIKTQADQQSTQPDPFNQATPADLGWLLAGIYQCALDGSGPLISTFSTEITMNECRQMVSMMRVNRVAALIGGGLPPEVPLARKYGWVNEVHGDAALITTPGADYVLVIMLRNKDWLNYDDSFPLIAELSRLTYNYFNPSALMPQTASVDVPPCSVDTIDPGLFSDLASGSLPPIR